MACFTRARDGVHIINHTRQLHFNHPPHFNFNFVLMTTREKTAAQRMHAYASSAVPVRRCLAFHWPTCMLQPKAASLLKTQAQHTAAYRLSSASTTVYTPSCASDPVGHVQPLTAQHICSVNLQQYHTSAYSSATWRSIITPFLQHHFTTARLP
jgi:hypothetical protein